MNLEDIRNKYQCDEGRTFAQWKEWVRKNKPSQAETHIVTAVAPNGSKFEKLIGGYTDAQNHAFNLVSHGYKNVKVFKSVNAGPMKLLRNFSSPLHGAKFKDSADSVDEIRQKYQEDKLSITSNGFANGSGTLKKDSRKGLKPFEVAFFVKGKDGKPFKTVRSKMAASLNEAKQWANSESRKYNGVTKVEVKEFKDEADYIELIRAKYSSDAYNLGMETKEFDPKAPLKVISVTTKKEPDGISGRVTFTKGQKKTSERFMVYKSGNWDVTPGGGFGITGLTAGDKQALMNAVRNKLSTMGIKAK